LTVVATLRDAGSIAAIVGASIACTLLVAGIVKWWLRRWRRRRFGRLLDQGNELQVRLSRITVTTPDDEHAALVEDLNAWWPRVEDFVGERNPHLRAVLRSEVGITPPVGSGVYAYWLAWLPQRIRQMEKVLSQL
jgi:hypothetical protein